MVTGMVCATLAFCMAGLKSMPRCCQSLPQIDLYMCTSAAALAQQPVRQKQRSEVMDPDSGASKLSTHHSYYVYYDNTNHHHYDS